MTGKFNGFLREDKLKAEQTIERCRIMEVEPP
jgi:hypothetical protein